MKDPVAAYIEEFPEPVKGRLLELRSLLQSLLPEATECINYHIPTFQLNGKNLVHFAGYKKHLGFYPTPSGITAFESELKPYKYAKGSVQFPLDQPLPVDLIQRMVAFRVEELTR